MKKALTHIVVVLTNFYILSYFIGILLMLSTVVIGGLNSMFVVVAMLSSLGVSIIYELMRVRFNFLTFGEHVVGNKDKSEILIQTNSFTISRIPIFILILLTLAINGNLLDGLSDGQVYSLGNVISFALLAGCLYYGMKNFMVAPQMLPIILIMLGLILTGFAFRYSPKAMETGETMFNIYMGLSIAWLMCGLVYVKYKTISTNPNTV